MVAVRKTNRVKVRNLAQHGINTDIEPFELPLNAFTGGLNMAFRGNKVGKSKGYSNILSPSPEAAIKMYTKDGNLYYGTQNNIYMYNGNTHNNMSRGGNKIELTVQKEGEGVDYTITLKSGAVQQTFTYISSQNPTTPFATPLMVNTGGGVEPLTIVNGDGSVETLDVVASGNTFTRSNTAPPNPIYWNQPLPPITNADWQEDLQFIVQASLLNETATPIAYQWYANNAPLVGENTPNYQLTGVEQNVDLRCEASTSITWNTGEVDDKGDPIMETTDYTLSTATRVVVDDGSSLVITKPLNIKYEIKEGETVDLEVVAKSTSTATPITYVWYKKTLDVDSDWVLIPSATTNIYTTEKLLKETDYKVEVTTAKTTEISETSIIVKPWVADTKVEVLQGLVNKIEGVGSTMSNLVEAVVTQDSSEPVLVITRTAATDVEASSPVNLNLTSKDSNRYTPTTEWFVTELSNVLVFSCLSNNPQYQAPYGYGFNDLPDWKDTWQTPRIRAYKNFLLCMSTVEDGLEYLQRIRWSDIAYPNEPPRSWDDTSLTNSAGFNDLSEARGKIIDGLPLGDSFVIYTEEEVYLMDYVGGSSIFRFRKADFAFNILAPECAVSVQGGHVVMTKDDIVFHRGVQPQSIAAMKIRDKLFSDIGKENYNKVKMVYVAPENEVWICYPDRNSQNLELKTRVAAYNFSNGTWTFREIPPAYDLHYGVLPSTGEQVVDDIDIIVDDYDKLVDGVGKDFRDSTLFASTSRQNNFMVLDENGLPAGESQIAFLEKSYMDFDEQGLPSESIKYLTNIYPQISGVGRVYIKVGSSVTPNSRIDWSEPQIFTVDEDYKVDFTLTGRYLSVRFEILDDSDIEISGYDMDVSVRSKR